MDLRTRVALFLELMKHAARVRFIFWPRKKNLDALALLGITREDAKARVLGLTPDEYVSGPEPDHNRPDLEVWVFGLNIEGREVYVKMQVTLDPTQCVCISFHVSERPLRFPLRETGRPSKEEE